jgi:hypothetical protein
MQGMEPEQLFFRMLWEAIIEKEDISDCSTIAVFFEL